MPSSAALSPFMPPIRGSAVMPPAHVKWAGGIAVPAGPSVPSAAAAATMPPSEGVGGRDGKRCDGQLHCSPGGGDGGDLAAGADASIRDRAGRWHAAGRKLPLLHGAGLSLP